MFEKRASLLLDYFLGGYFLNINREKLSASVLKGELGLNDLEIRPEAFTDLNLPFRIVAGYLGSFHVKLSWTKLKSEPVIVEIERVYLILAPLKHHEGKRMQERQDAINKKRKYLDYEHEQFKPLEEVEVSDSKDADGGGDSFAARLGEKIVDNLQISIKNVYIRFEDEFSNPGSSIAIGISLEELSAQSCGTDWLPTFIKDSSNLIHKIVQLKNFGMFMDCSSELLSRTLPIEHAPHARVQWWKSSFDSHFSSKTSYHSIIHPISGQLKARINKDVKATNRHPKLWATLDFATWQLDVTETQYQRLMGIMEMIASQAHMENRELCPAKTPKELPREWWKYSITAVIKKIRHVKGRVSWKEISSFSVKRREYIQLYMIKTELPWNANLTQEMRDDFNAQLEMMEDSIPLDHVLMYRKVAQAEIRRRVIQHREMIKKENEKKGFFSFFSRKSSKATETVFKPLDEKEMKLLYETIDFKPSEESSKLISLGDDFVMTDISINLKLGALRAYRNNRATPLVLLEFQDTNLTFKAFPRTIFAKISFGHLDVTEPFITDSAYRNIVSAERLTAGKPLFEASFQTFPPVKDADFEVKLALKPLDVYVNAPWLVELIQFLAVKGANLVFLEEVITQQMVNLKERAKQNMKRALLERKRIRVNTEISAPTLIFPLDYRNANSEAFVVHLGHLHLSMNPATFTLAEAQYATELPKEKFYDNLTANLENFRAYLVKDIARDRESNYTEQSIQTSVIEPITLNVKAQLLGLKQLEHLTRTIVDGSIRNPICIEATSMNLLRLAAIGNSLSSHFQQNEEKRGEGESRGLDAKQLVTATIKQTARLATIAITETYAGKETEVTPKIIKDLLVGTFKLSKLVIRISDDRPSLESRLIEIAFDKVSLLVSNQNRLLRVLFKVESMEALDLLRSSEAQRCYLISPLQKRSRGIAHDSNSLFVLDYCAINRRSPEYANVDSKLQLDFTGIEVNIYQESIARLVYMLESVRDHLQSLSEEQQQAEQLNINLQESAGPAETSQAALNLAKIHERISLSVTATIDSLRLNLWKDHHHLLHSSSESFAFSADVYSTMRTSAKVSIGTLRLCDKTLAAADPDSDAGYYHQDIVSVKDNSDFLSLSVEIYSPLSTEKFLGKVKVELAALQFVFLQRLIRDVGTFKTEFDAIKKVLRMGYRKTAMFRAKKPIVKVIEKEHKVKQPKPIELDIQMKSPTVLIPQHSSSPLVVLFSLGNLSITNAIQGENQEIYLQISDIFVSLFNSLEQESTGDLLHKTTFDSRIVLPLQAEDGLDSAIDVFASFKELSMDFSREYLGFTLKALMTNLSETSNLPSPAILRKASKSELKNEKTELAQVQTVHKNLTKYRAGISFEINRMFLSVKGLATLEADGFSLRLLHSVTSDGGKTELNVDLATMSIVDGREMEDNVYLDILHIGKKSAILPELQQYELKGHEKALSFHLERAADGSVVIESELFRPTVSIVPEFINDVWAFVFHFAADMAVEVEKTEKAEKADGLSDASDVDDETISIASSTVPEPASKAMVLDAIFRVRDLCFQTVENSSKRATNGIIGYCCFESEIKFTPTTKSISTKLMHVSVFSSVMRPQPTFSTPLLKPLNVILHYAEGPKRASSVSSQASSMEAELYSTSSPQGERLREGVLTFDVGASDVSLSYSDIQLLMKIKEGFSKIQNPQASLEVDEEEFAVPDSPSSPISAQSTATKQKGPLDKLMLKIEPVSLGIFNNIYGSGHRVPVLRMKLDLEPLVMSGLSKLEETVGNFTIVGNAEYFNDDLSAWEPITEQFFLDIGYQQQDLSTSLTFQFTRQLYINVSQSMLNTLARAVKALRSSDGADKGKLLESRQNTSEYHPFWLHNQTGCQLEIRGFNTLVPDEKVSFSQDIRSYCYTNNPNGELQFDMYLPDNPIPLRYCSPLFDRSGIKCLSSNDDSAPKVIYQVENVDSTKYITLKSMQSIHNDTQYILDVRVLHDDEELCTLGSVRPGEYRSFPVHVTKGMIGIRIAEKGFTWTEKSSEISLQNGKNKSAIVRCIQGHDRTCLYHFSIRSQNMRVSKASADEQLVWVVESPIKVHNLLPVPVDISVRNGPNDPAASVLTCKEGDYVFSHFKNSDAIIQVKYHKFAWSSEVDLKPPKPNQQSFLSQLKLSKGKDRTLFLQARIITRGNSKEIILFAPYWIVSHLDHSIKLKSSDGMTGHFKGRPEYMRKPKLFSFLTANDKSNTVSIQYRDSSWSQPINLDAVGNSTVLEMVDVKNGQKYMIAATISLANGKFNRTKILKLSPAIILENHTRFPIEYAAITQPQTADAIQVLPQSAEHVFHPSSTSPTPSIKFRIPSLDCDWSGAFSVIGSGFHVIALPRPFGEEYFAQVDVTIQNSTAFVTFIEESLLGPPIKIQNQTDMPVFFEQKGVSKSRKVEPYNFLRYALDQPHGEQAIVLQFSLGAQTVRREVTLSSNKIYFTVDIPTPGGQVNRKVDVELNLEGPTRVIKICDEVDRSQLGRIDPTKKKKKVNLSLFQKKKPVQPIKKSGNMKGKTAEIDTTSSFSVHLVLPAIGISVVDGEPKELLYISAYDVTLSLILSEAQRAIELSVVSAQIDDQMRESAHPVMLHQITKGDRKLIECTIIQSLENPHVDFYHYIGILVQPIDLRLSDTLLCELLQMYYDVSKLFEPPADVGMKAMLANPKRNGTIERPRYIYIEELRVYSLEFNLTFNCRDGIKEIISFSSSPAMSVLEAMTPFLANIEGRSIALTTIAMGRSFTTKQALVSRIVKSYIKNTKYEIYKVIGGLEIIGKPVVLVEGIAKGISEFVTQPAKAIVKGPAEFGKGLAKGTGGLIKHVTQGAFGAVGGVANAVNAGMAAVVGKSSIKDLDRTISNKGPTNAVEGVAQGVAGLGHGVFKGVTGLVTKPIEGAKKGGLVGAMKGFGKGLAGVVANPIAGAMVMTSKIAEGVKQQAEVLSSAPVSKVARSRPPRYLRADNVLRSYDAEESLMALMLYESGNGAFVSEYYEQSFALPSKQILFITNRSLVVLKMEDGPSNTKLIWSASLSGIEHAYATSKDSQELVVVLHEAEDQSPSRIRRGSSVGQRQEVAQGKQIIVFNDAPTRCECQLRIASILGHDACRTCITHLA
eukprot:TRINITY_DN4205_c0_g2_i1.p1 TRINITY_DN4205_c0_g2~~TRINITY_DN4205_c0_g2_i1.p1  ORF type:complete len:3130 (-),score=671.29 TRINITY_DN4205_c0_g2_i1:145-9534(-)